MPTFDDLLTRKDPPAKRKPKTDGDLELHLTEGAVMLALSMHLFEEFADMRRIEIHPDGEHGKQFDIRGWLENQGFTKIKKIGTTQYGGLYKRDAKEIVVSLKPGLGDVVAYDGCNTIVAECKGGVINTRHAGQLSKLRRGLCEVIGLLMTRSLEGERHLAVVPDTIETERLAKRMAQRCRSAGIEIALVDGNGRVSFLNVRE